MSTLLQLALKDVSDVDNTVVSLESSEELRSDIVKLFSEFHALSMAKTTLEGFQLAYSSSLENAGSVSPYLEEAIRPTLEGLFGADSLSNEISLEEVSGFINRLAQSMSNVVTRLGSTFKHWLERISKDTSGIRKEIQGHVDTINKLDASAEPKSATMSYRGGSKLHYNHSVDPNTLSEQFPKAAQTASDLSNAVTGFADRLLQHVYETQQIIAETDLESKKDIARLELKARQQSAVIIREYFEQLRALEDKPLLGGSMVDVVKTNTFKLMSDTGYSSDPALLPNVLNITRIGKYKDRGKTDVPTVDQLRNTASGVLEYITTAEKAIDEFNRIHTTMMDNTSSGKYVKKLGARTQHDPNAKLGDMIVAELTTMAKNYFSDNFENWTMYLYESLVQITDYQVRTAQAGKDYLEVALKQY